MFDAWKTNYKFHCIILKNLEKWRKYIRWIEYYLKYNINKNAIPFFFCLNIQRKVRTTFSPTMKELTYFCLMNLCIVLHIGRK